MVEQTCCLWCGGTIDYLKVAVIAKEGIEPRCIHCGRGLDFEREAKLKARMDKNRKSGKQQWGRWE